MAIAAASSFSICPSHCHQCYTEELSPNILCKRNGRTGKHVFDGCGASNLSVLSFRCKIPFFGPASHVSSPSGRDDGLTKVSVAADYPDSVPDSSSYISKGGYHPLEDLEPSKRSRVTKLSAAEIARTTVEANSRAVLAFPGAIHCEPHDHTSWSEFKYVIDDYGDIFFEIFDDNNILEDPGASNPVKAFIGMDVPLYENTPLHDEYNISDIGNLDDIIFDDHYFEIMDSEASDIPVDWGMPDSSNGVHPVYFAKRLAKAISMDYDRKMDYPSNGVSILGCLRPAFLDEESYIRRLFIPEDRDDYDWESQGDDNPSSSSRYDGHDMSSTLYRLEIVRIELSSIYGIQSSVSLQDFQDAEPDILVHSTSAIIDRFNKKGINCNMALKALCKKKGLQVEGANLISIDSLGMDVRVFTGVEVQTHRFPFKARALTEIAAEKKIQQLLFPRSLRRKLKSHRDGLKDTSRY
ncbi:PREDICTED: uncharacterized protein At3g49140 [Tarenaya hassleriana]|uniref:uncharacterized protein At3g49140 n=1 Tax=Tarenaya hassleriana TaxID=28532 RepID=UPI00053C172B|nr:PREDICTED: uncharacterized protein At3g49140 [Tarenaya hassleriana]